MKNWREFKAEILTGSFLFLAASAIFIVNAVRGFSDKEAEFLEHFGSFIGGYFGTLFSLGAVLLLFVTLKAQRQASEDQNFETKYFALLTLHRSNVEEMRLWTTDESGRRIFLILIQEVRNASNLIQRAAPTMNYLDHEKLLQAAYYVMFFGVGQNSTRMLLKALDGIGIEKAFAGSIVREVEQFQQASAEAR